MRKEQIVLASLKAPHVIHYGLGRCGPPRSELRRNVMAMWSSPGTMAELLAMACRIGAQDEKRGRPDRDILKLLCRNSYPIHRVYLEAAYQAGRFQAFVEKHHLDQSKSGTVRKAKKP